MNDAQNSRPILIYQSKYGHGRALQIRLLFRIADAAFEDRRLSEAEWRAFKVEAPWGALPVLQDGERLLFDSCAIVSHVARRVGLWPEEPWEQARSIALINAVDEMWTALSRFPRIRNPIAKLASLRSIIKVELPAFCARVDAQRRGRYLTGDSISAADVSVYSLFAVVLARGGRLGARRVVERYPGVAALIAGVGDEPAVIEHLAARRQVSALA